MARRPPSDQQPSLPLPASELIAAPAIPAVAPALGRRGARLREVNRGQLAWGPVDLDAMLPQDHVVRAIWAVVERFDLTALYRQIEARGETAGAPAIDPKRLLGVWVHATSDGQGSARKIASLCKMHTAYRWLCGGVTIGDHTLSDFRSQQGNVLDDLITHVLARRMKHDLIVLHRVAQDGMRVRADAGAASFRREQTLDALLAQARAPLDAVTRDASDPSLTARQAAARQRGAEDRLTRLEAALAPIPDVAAVKKQSGARDKTPRASTTDPEARVMKMPDGGFRPADNVQFATTTDKARVIVGVSVSNRGSDAHRSTPILDPIEQRTGQRPKERLVDGGHAQHEALDAAAAKDVTVYAPLPKRRRDDGRDPQVARPDDSEAVGEWRQRMGTAEAKGVDKERAATAETVNADVKANRGRSSLAVRGSGKVLSSVLWVALTYDILRLLTLS